MNNLDRNFNWEVLGHNKQLLLLEHFIKSDNISHAYLFYGRKNLGKYKIVNSFVKNLLCYSDKSIQKSEYPCDRCVQCTQINKHNHTDINQIDKIFDEKTKKLKKNISINQVKDLQENLQKAGFQNSYKFGIIKNAHTLSEGAYNSLLKTLEEPTKNSVLILIADDITEIPKTILSRCQILEFNQIEKNIIMKHLMQTGVNKERAEDITSLSAGYPEFAINFINNKRGLDNQIEKIDFFINILDSSMHERFKKLEKEIKSLKSNQEQIEYLDELLSLWIVLVRDLILIKNSLDRFVNNKLLLHKLNKIQIKYSIEDLYVFVNIIKRIQNVLKNNINPQLAIENVLLGI